MRRQRQHGFGLIEVLVALVLFSVGILGAVALQARAEEYSRDAEDRGRAALMANELAAAMWAAKTTSLAAAVTTAWQTRLADQTVSGLPNATGTVGAPDADGMVTVTITWKSPSKKAGDSSNQFVTKVVGPS